MDYQKYIEHLSVTMPGTMPMSHDSWERAQLEKAKDGTGYRLLKPPHSISGALKSHGLDIDTLGTPNSDIMRRYYEDD